MNCEKGENVELLKDVVDDCEETDSFEAISVDVIVLMKKQFRRTKIYKMSNMTVWEECFYLLTRLALPVYLDRDVTNGKFWIDEKNWK